MLFSVIVPIYKVEKYLVRCIDSVLNQSFEDFELILVDDGSPDGCPDICDQYAEKDGRIKVIHKENGGLVSARQAGIEIAKGEYVFNLDGDDAITPDALMSAYEIIKETDADIVSFSYNSYEKGEIKEKVDDLADEGLYENESIKKYIYPRLLVDKNMEHLFYFLWGKAIKRSLVTPHQLNVSRKISLGEDLSCIVPCFLDAEKIYMSKKSVYLYTIRDDSISTSFKTEQLTQIEEVIKLLHTLNGPEDFKEQISRYSCFMCFAILAAAAEGNHFECIGEIKKLIENSLHKEEIKRAEFSDISTKSKIAIKLIKGMHIKTAFYFLNICKRIKDILNKG